MLYIDSPLFHGALQMQIGVSDLEGRGRNFRFPIDFAGHRHNGAATTAQSVIKLPRLPISPFPLSRGRVRVGVSG